LVLRDESFLQDLPRFATAVADHGITLVNLPTAFFHMLAASSAEAHVPLAPALRLMVVGGEQVSPRALQNWRRAYPALRWMNGYGPTETTITASLDEAGSEIAAG